MYTVLARWSYFIYVAAERLLRRKIVLGSLLIFAATFPSSLDIVVWINKLAFAVLYLLFMLWLFDRYRRRQEPFRDKSVK
jgi:Ca2+/Na+ antiporter